MERRGLDRRDRADAVVASVEGICIMSTELEGEDDARRPERLLDGMLEQLLPDREASA